jgi:hypothetical protein
MKNSWVLYDSYSDYVKANIVLGRLKNEGIECMLNNENIVTLNPGYGNAIGGIKLYVLESNVEKLTSIAQKLQNEMLQNAECSKCGAIGIALITKQKVGNWFMAIIKPLFTNYAEPATCYQCNSCKHTFDKLNI